MRSRAIFSLLVGLIAVLRGLAQTNPQERVVQSVVPSLDSNSSCSSAVELHNLGSREVTAEVEAHKTSGALVPLAGLSGMQVRLDPGERAEYKLELPEETTGAWALVREIVPLPQLSPVLAVSGSTECVASDELYTTVRDVAWPFRNPWFSADVGHGDNGIIALINTSEQPVQVWGCYSSGVLYAVPDDSRPTAELTPVCSAMIQELVPPSGSRQFPVTLGGNSHFLLTARGDHVVLQMLRPVGASVKAYRVDSTITFGKELPGN